MGVNISEFVVLGIFTIFFLIGTFFVSTTLLLMQRMRRDTVNNLNKKAPSSVYCIAHKFLLRECDTESLLLSFISSRQLYVVLYIIFSSTIYFFIYPPIISSFFVDFARLILFIFFVSASLVIFAHYLPRSWVLYRTSSALKFSIPLSSLFLLMSLPFSFFMVIIMRMFKSKAAFAPFTRPEISSKEKLMEIILESDDDDILSEPDKKLLQSVFTFRDRIAREVMVPRANLFAIPNDMTMRDAVSLFENEGYSRVPVYKNNIDEIVGVVMFKDLLIKCIDSTTSKEKEKILALPVETIVSKVLYTPETKKISQLLQEFRKKQRHLAIVVDEYGNTAGVITIEDILEELVGEIADEYDHEPSLFKSVGKNCWVVDGRMNILDLEEELGIKIPEEGEYDTVAGYIFFRLNAIPEKGVVIHHDDFELEILKSSDRMVELVKIIPTQQNDSSENQYNK